MVTAYQDDTYTADAYDTDATVISNTYTGDVALKLLNKPITNTINVALKLLNRIAANETADAALAVRKTNAYTQNVAIAKRVNLGFGFGPPVVLLRFENNLLDSSGYNATVTVTGSTVYTSSGWIGSGFSLNGATYLTVTNASLYDFETTDAFFISYSTNIPNTGTQRPIISKNGGGKGWQISNFGNQHQFSLTGASGQLVMRTASGFANKHDFQWTYDGSGVPAGVKCFVDGNSVALTTVTNALAGSMKNGLNLVLAANNDGSAPQIASMLDEVIIGRGTLSSTDATNIKNGNYGGLVYTGDAALKLKNITRSPGGAYMGDAYMSDAYTVDDYTIYSADAALKLLKVLKIYTGDVALKLLNKISTYTSNVALSTRKSQTYTGNVALKLVNKVTQYTSNVALKLLNKITTYTGDAALALRKVGHTYTGDAYLLVQIFVQLEGDCMIQTVLEGDSVIQSVLEGDSIRQ